MHTIHTILCYVNRNVWQYYKVQIDKFIIYLFIY